MAWDYGITHSALGAMGLMKEYDIPSRAKGGPHMDTMIPQLQLAQAYVPFQVYTQYWPLLVGLERGTIFPELWRPYEPRQK